MYKQRQNMNIKLELYTMPQLKVPEAPLSAMTPIFNMKHRKQYKKLIAEGLF
jgi:hypothetical protein